MPKQMSNTTAIVIVVIVVVMLIAFATALIVSYRITRRAQDDNRRLVEELRQERRDEYRRSAESLPLAEESARERQQLAKAAADMQALSELPDEELARRVEQQMVQRRLYAGGDTSLKYLARELGLTQKRLSEAVSASPYGSLGEMVNAQRIECACRLIETKPEWTIEAISAESGFSTRRTFQNLFKAHTGVTPTQYRALKMREQPQD